MTVSLIVAHDLNNGIGKDNDLVWHCPEDMAYFKTLTTTTADPAKQNMVLMGRRTWESIPTAFKPLKNRINMVLTRAKNKLEDDNVEWVNSINQALSQYHKKVEEGDVESLFCIGGAQLYNDWIKQGLATTLYITVIHERFDVDCYFPHYKNHYELVSQTEIATSSKGLMYQFCVFNKKS